MTKIVRVPITAGFCDYWHPIYYSRNDTLTDDTKRQIIRSNEVGDLLCGKH